MPMSPPPPQTRYPFSSTTTAPRVVTEDQKQLLRRAHEAVRRAKTLFPKPIADVLEESLYSFVDVGFRFCSNGQGEALINSILDFPVPDKKK